MAIVSYKIFVEVLVSKAQSQASKEEARRKFLTTRRQQKSSSSSMVMVVFTIRASSLRIRTINRQHHSPISDFGFRHMGRAFRHQRSMNGSSLKE